MELTGWISRRVLNLGRKWGNFEEMMEQIYRQQQQRQHPQQHPIQCDNVHEILAMINLIIILCFWLYWLKEWRRGTCGAHHRRRSPNSTCSYLDVHGTAMLNIRQHENRKQRFLRHSFKDADCRVCLDFYGYKNPTITQNPLKMGLPWQQVPLSIMILDTGK
jgi:hypothetical protein